MFYRTHIVVTVVAVVSFWGLIWAINSRLDGSGPGPVVASEMVPRSNGTLTPGPSDFSVTTLSDSVEITPDTDEPIMESSSSFSNNVIYTNAGGTAQQLDSADELAALTAALDSSSRSDSSNSIAISGSASAATSGSGSSSGVSSGSSPNSPAGSSSGSSGGSGTSSGGSSSGTSDTGTSAVDSDVPIAGTEESVDPMIILEELKTLEPLPKVHYTWGLGTVFISDRDNELLYEVARLTHALSIVGETTPPVQIDNCVYTCVRVNKTNPDIPCSIAINYSPWHRKFMPEVPWSKYIPADYNYTIFSDPTYKEEIEFFVLKMTNVKNWVAESNQKYGTDIKISAILLDCERFYKRDHDPFWNARMRQALDVIHLKAVEIFPDTRIQWYGRGITRPDGTTWRETGLWTGKEIKSPLSCSLYMLPELEAMRETFRKTCALADTYEINEVTPYVALAAGYYRDPVKGVIWRQDWDYDTTYSYQMGMELNDFCEGTRPDTYPAYNRAVVIDLFPDPFEPTTPAWGKHFLAYCKGASEANKN